MHPDSMTPEMRDRMMRRHHRQTLWVYWMIVMLGVWVLVSPATFSYGTATVMPAGGRIPWLSLHTRTLALIISDVISGLLLIVLGWRALSYNRPVSLWLACFVGIWLSFAPLLFWAPKPLIYLNDTLCGVLVIALTILIPGMPNMINYMEMGGDQPPGWSYNPSSWVQRSLMIALAFAGWLVARYLTAYQLGYIPHAWDPFFGQGSEQVLTSHVSRMLPVSDAGLGAFAYTFEFLMGWMGGPARWRTMPWMVTFFGILVIPLGMVQIALVISQPVLVGHWCSFCLLGAIIMLPMIPLEVDEVVAMGQFLLRAKRRGEPLWRTFWLGGADPEASQDQRTPGIETLPQQPWAVLRASVWGMSLPWQLALTTLLGIWLMFEPAALGVARPMASINHLTGALIVAVSVIAMGEAVRLVRLFNILLGLAVVILPWVISGGSTASRVASLAIGLIVIVLTLPRGAKHEVYGPVEQAIK